MPMQSRAVRSLSPAPLFAGAVLAGLLLTAGCQKGPQQGVAATVNGKPIMQSEVDKLYAAQLANNPQQPQQTSADQGDSAKLNVLRDLIDAQIIEQRAAKLNLTATNDEVDAKFADMKAPYTEEQFSGQAQGQQPYGGRRQARSAPVPYGREAAQQGDQLQGHRHRYGCDRLLQRAQGRVQPDREPVPPRADHRHRGAIAQLRQSAELQGDLGRRREEEDPGHQEPAGRGRDFGSLAINFSENPQTASNGGDMGMLSESQMRSNPLVFEALGKLKPGQATDIIPFPDSNDPRKIGGYAIFQLIERAAAGQRDLNDPRVQQAIRQQLHDSRSQLLKTAYFEILRDQAKVENFLAEQVFKETVK